MVDVLKNLLISDLFGLIFTSWGALAILRGVSAAFVVHEIIDDFESNRDRLVHDHGFCHFDFVASSDIHTEFYQAFVHIFMIFTFRKHEQQPFSGRKRSYHL